LTPSLSSTTPCPPPYQGGELPGAICGRGGATCPELIGTLPCGEVNSPLRHAIWRRKAAAARKTNNPRTRQLVVVSFGMGSPSKHWSFPRRRESTPSAAHFQWLAQ